MDDSSNREIPELGDGIQEVAARARVLETLFQLLTSDRDYNDFCRETLNALSLSIQCEATSLLEINTVEQVIFFRAATGHNSEEVMRFTVPLGKGIVGHVIESKQPLIVANAAENQIHLASIARAVGFDVRCLAAYPIIIRDKVYGVIEFINRVGSDSFSDQDLSILEQLMPIVAKALEIRLMLAWAKQQQTPTGEAA